jgi:long-chain acyl-CoA synthetase
MRFLRIVEKKVKPITCKLYEAKPNPITGQHVELTVQSTTNNEVDKAGLKAFLSGKLPNHMMPKRLKVASVSVGRRFKRS